MRPYKCLPSAQPGCLTRLFSFSYALPPQTYPRTYTQKMSLILASASETRLSLLQSAGLSCVAHPVRVDEDSIKASLQAEGALPHDIADALAEHKARRGASAFPSDRVLGCDQILDLKGKVFSKPVDKAEAKDHLLALQGRQHRLLSAAVIYEDMEPVWRAIGEVKLSMHVLTEDDIDQYLDRAWPDVASSVGAYQAEALGAQLFSRIDGDWFSVLGLPLLQILSYFRVRGWLQS